MKILYGTVDKSIDVTDICVSRLIFNNIIQIQAGDDSRTCHFSDPVPGVLKKIFISNAGTLSEYDHECIIIINTLTGEITTLDENDMYNKITDLHCGLTLKYGNMEDELPEQKMTVQYLTGNEKVLEIGGNIGRNSLIIASILKDSHNLVTLECDVNIAKQLTENRDLNNIKFHIENSALSKRKLIQRGWDTIPSDTLLDGYTWVNTISLDSLRKKYNIEFDTLVLDCEGAFYYILMDMPEILDNIKLIIVENDYGDISHKKYVDTILVKKNFVRQYVESGPHSMACPNSFYEVWRRLEC
jgi:FkbM family methyltransferase